MQKQNLVCFLAMIFLTSLASASADDGVAISYTKDGPVDPPPPAQPQNYTNTDQADTPRTESENYTDTDPPPVPTPPTPTPPPQADNSTNIDARWFPCGPPCQHLGCNNPPYVRCTCYGGGCGNCYCFNY